MPLDRTACFAVILFLLFAILVPIILEAGFGISALPILF